MYDLMYGITMVPARIIIQSEEQIDSNFHVDIQNPFSDKYTDDEAAPLFLIAAIPENAYRGQYQHAGTKCFFIATV